MSQKRLRPVEDIARQLRTLRGEKSISDVSMSTGIGISALNNYEAGLRIPRDEAKAALANYYQRSVDDIFLRSKPHFVVI